MKVAWTRRWDRGLLLALSVASLGLLAAGCGGGTPGAQVANLGTTTTTTGAAARGATSDSGTAGAPGPATSSGGASPAGGQMTMVGGSVEQMTKFATCMRQNGEPNFPDPNAQGQISVSGIDPGSTQYQKAQQACQKDMPNKGAPPSPAQQAQMREQALAYSACMRKNGVPNFPDPQFGSGGSVTLKIGGPGSNGGIDPNSPQFQSAQQACQKDMPGQVKSPDGAGPKSAGIVSG